MQVPKHWPGKCCIIAQNNMSLEKHIDVIAMLIQQGYAYQEISVILNNQYGVQRGSSVANLRHFCTLNGINPGANVIPQDAVEHAVEKAVLEVGPTYGRKMMTGYLVSKGIKVAENRVGVALGNIAYPYKQERLQRVRNTNPVPYYAAYYGHKLHMDQNEKLGMFGCTHVVAVDGYSSSIVKYASMPMKNNITIYHDVYRAATLENGIWDTIRVDHGKEFYLSLFMQDLNKEKRLNTSRQPFVQSESKHNLRVERIWPEINNRVNYPIKQALVELVDNEDIHMDEPLERFCISNLTVQVAKLGLTRCVQAWNNHRIDGRGIPNTMKSNKQNAEVSEHDFPDGNTAAQMYAEKFGRALTEPAPFAPTPFRSLEQQQQCDADFVQLVPDLGPLLEHCSHRQYEPFKQALKSLIELTKHHCDM